MLLTTLLPADYSLNIQNVTYICHMNEIADVSETMNWKKLNVSNETSFNNY